MRASYSPGQTGIDVAGMEKFDELIPALLEKWDIPGGAVAIAKDGRLVFAKGYGFADIESEEPVLPDSLFRIASISKPVTAVAILTLVEDGLLDLDERAFDVLDHLEAPDGEALDSRINEVTVRQLLYHSGGWESDVAPGAVWWSHYRVTSQLDIPGPIVCEDVIRFMLGQPLDFDPGTQFAYSNFGYCILGRIVEEKSGQPYEEFVKENVLMPIGIRRARIGGTLLEDQADGEVRYHGFPGLELAYSVFPDGPQRVPWPYGGYYIEGFDSFAGWIASPPDLVRFALSLDGSKPPAVLEPETVQLMTSRPDPALRDTKHYYGMGWSVLPIRDGVNWWHNGSLDETRSFLVRTYHGIAWAALFNSRPKESREFGSEIDRLMWEGVRDVNAWPTHDLFPEFGYE